MISPFLAELHRVKSHREPTAAEIAEHRIVDALIQYQDGKYAGVPRPKIPEAIIREALAEHDPTKPWRLGPKHRRQTARPACPACGPGTRVRSIRTEHGRWRCFGCWAVFREADAAARTTNTDITL